MASIGYNASGGATDALALEVGNPYNYRAYVPDAPTSTGWATSISMRTGKATATSPSMRGILFKAGSSPGAIAAQTATFNPSVSITSGADGQWRTDNLTATYIVLAGTAYPLGAIATGARALVGMTGSANIPGKTNYTFYSRDDSTMPPADPMSWVASSSEGWMAIVLNYDVNVKPATPINRLMNGAAAGGQVSPTATPTMQWDFSDPNETLSNGLVGDSLNKVEIKVTRVSDGATMWYLSGSAATSAERSARQILRTYAGSTLAADGTQYQWQARHSDQCGLWSDWSSLIQFTVGAGSVSVSGTGLGTPTGKQTTVTPGPFVGKWTHTGGLSTTKAQLRLVDSSGNPISGYASADITKAVAPNSNISITWADTLFATSLNWGGTYGWQMRGKASDGNYSGWSATVPFTTDEAPSVPTTLTPNGISVASRPTLTFKMTDPDNTVATGLVGKIELFDGTNTLIGTYAATLRAGTTDTWDLVTTSTHLAAFGSFSWRAYGGDGTLWSGRQTVEASATRSATATFTYAAGPSVTLTSPTDGGTITNTTPTLAWTAATQAAYRVVIDDVTTGARILDTGSIATTVTGYTVPDGLITTSGDSYRFTLTITDSGALTNTATATVTLTITQPDPIAGWLVSPYALPGDNVAAGEASAVVLSFTPSADPNFYYYLIRRQPAAGAPIEPNDESVSAGPGGTKIFRIYDVNATRLIDYTPASGVAYRYQVTQITKVGSNTLIALYAVGEIMVTFAATILFDVSDPEGTRVVLPARENRALKRTRDQTLLPAWGRQAPTALRSAAWSKPVQAVYPIVAATPDGVNEIIRRLDYMDADAADVCFRNGRGYRNFGTIADLTEADPPLGATRAMDITFQPTDYLEGV